MQLEPKLGEVITTGLNESPKVWAYTADGNIKPGFPEEWNTVIFEDPYRVREEFMDSTNSEDFNAFNPCSHYVSGCRVFNDIDRNVRFYDTSDGDYGYVQFRKVPGYLWPRLQFGTLSNPYGTDTYPALRIEKLWTAGVDGFKYVNLPSNLTELRERSLRAMLPGIRPRLSLVNSLIELKDFRTIGKTIVKAKSVFAAFRKKGFANATLRRLFHSTADGYLQSEFNIRPLLADIGGFKTALSSLRREIQNLLDRERSPQERHFSCPIAEDIYYDRVDNLNYNPMPLGDLDGFPIQIRAVSYKTALFCATIRYSYTLTELERQNAFIGALLDSLGVNFNPAIIWNAYPWTFVVDWLVKVGQFVDQFKVRNIEPRCTIHEYCCSAKVERTIECSLSTNNNGHFTPSLQPMVPMSRTHETAYIRVVGVPDILSSYI